MDAAIESVAPPDTVDRLIAAGAAALGAAGVSAPRLDAEVLLAAAVGVDRTALYARGRECLPPSRQHLFRALLERRCAREPLQYIVGRQEFWSLDFAVTPDVLIPRPETELLVELTVAMAARGSASRSSGIPLLAKEGSGEVLKWRVSNLPLAPSLVRRGSIRGNEHDITICDAGTGSGCIAVALATELPHAEIWALDMAPAALAVAQANARRNRVADRIHFFASDLFTAVGGARFEAIVCNPPYVRAGALPDLQPEIAWEPREAVVSGPDGLEVIRRLLVAAPGHLTDGGWLFVEIGADQAESVESLARAARFRRVSVHADYAGLPRVVAAQR
jgi:release factor glutamine methyltransferase